METQTKKNIVPIPTWAWFAAAAIMILIGIVQSHMAVHGFMNDVAIGRSNHVYIRAEHPYNFWVYNISHIFCGILGFILAIFSSWSGYKKIKFKAS
ncbi:MAG: hypothetical protein M0023_08675 [Desulfobacteraceae bacterium]|nr:hypothetical protein [Desulfobacteraceae bacterium]